MAMATQPVPELRRRERGSSRGAAPLRVVGSVREVLFGPDDPVAAGAVPTYAVLTVAAWMV